MSTPDEGRYSRVSRRIWNDERFRGLSQPKPSGGWLFIRLLTGPELSCIPGLFQAWSGGLANALRWSQKDFDRCMKEVLDQGLARVDWSCGLVWLPNALSHNEPSSPNVVASWRKAARELPDCKLLRDAIAEIGAYLEGMGPEWLAAWDLAGTKVPRAVKIPAEIREKVRARDRDCCRYCTRTVNWKDRRGPLAATYDHVDPAGGSTVENLAVACRSCNSRKGFRTPEMAGMPLLAPRSLPRSEPKRTQERTQVAPGNQDQEQDQEPEQDHPAAAEIINLSGHQRGGATPEAAAAAELESLEIRKRAACVLANKQLTAAVDVGQWPECQALGIAVAQAFGQKWHGFGEYERDSALRAAVGLLARFDWPELELAVERAKTDAYFADTRRQGLSSFSLEVVRRLLATPRRAEERQAQQQYTYFCDGTRNCRSDKHDEGCRRAAASGAAQ